MVILMINSLLLAFSLLFVTGCSDKLVLAKPPCVNMSEIQEPKLRTIRVYNSDVDLYNAYINEFRTKIQNQNDLIRRMNFNCTKWELKQYEDHYEYEDEIK